MSVRYCLVTLLLAAITFSTSVAAIAAELSPREALAREIYEELLEIDTTAEHGSTGVAAEAVAKRLRAAGVPAADIAVLGPKPNKHNLVARLHGSGAEKPLLLLAHLDVVEAKREDWTTDPFTLVEQDGYFYARGSADDKAMASIFTALAIEYARDKKPLRRDVILALTADEEGGPDNGVDWLLKNQRALVDAALVVNEGGGGALRGGKRLYNAIQAAEKSYLDYTLTVRDKGGHSSRPTGENAIYRLAAALGRLEAHRFPVELNDVTRAWLARMATIESGELAQAMGKLAKNPKNAKAEASVAQQPSYNAQLRTTCTATRLEGGHADNALPQLARALVNCRVTPGHSAEEMLEQLEAIVADPKLEIALEETDTSAPASPLEPSLLASVEQITQALWPGVPVLPTMSAGASDSRFFRAAGVPAYGVSGLFGDIDDVRAHGRDERMRIVSYYEGLEFLARLVEALAGAR